MRFLLFGLLGSVMAPVNMWPRGCQMDTPPVAQNTQQVSQQETQEQTVHANKIPHFSQPTAEELAQRDPLIPPILLEGELPAGWKRQLASPAMFIDPEFQNADFSADFRAHFHAHGKDVCASGCAASRHPTPVLAADHFRKLLFDYSKQPMTENSEALEELLYYGRQTEQFLKQYGKDPLDDERLALLERELKCTHALISFRLVDENGIVRTHMPPTRVPLDRRHEFEMEVHDLPPLETSGTVKRVGLHHLWTRI